MELHGKAIPSCMIGTWAWGAGMNGSKMVFGRSYSEQQLAETFEAAYKASFYLWDTAEVYGMGNAERMLKKFVKGKSNIIISTKHQPGKKYKDGEVTRAINGSLERLGINSIDLYWLHLPIEIQKNMIEMAVCVKKGIIKNIGISNCNIEQIKEANNVLKKHGLKLAAVQNHYSLLTMDRQQEVLEYCKANNILFFGYMILEQGALSGHYDEKHRFPLFSMRGMTFGKKKFHKIQKLIDYERFLAEKYDVDVSQIPIAWSLAKGVIPIVGLTKPHHALSLADSMNVKLQLEEMKQLEDLAHESGVICKGIWE